MPSFSVVRGFRTTAFAYWVLPVLKSEAAHLTPREIDVLRLMGNGYTNKAIVETLGITLDTTNKHVQVHKPEGCT